MAPISDDTPQRKHIDKIYLYNDKQRLFLHLLRARIKELKKTNNWTTACQAKAYHQALTHTLQFNEEAVIESENRTAFVQFKTILRAFHLCLWVLSEIMIISLEGRD